MASVPFVISADRVGRQAHLHPERDVLGIGRHVDHVAAHARSAAVDHRRHERHRDASAPAIDTMVNAFTCPRSAIVDLLEVGAEARRAGVAADRRTRTARRALAGDQVGMVAEDQVIDQRDLSGHDAIMPRRGPTKHQTQRPGSASEPGDDEEEARLR